MADSIYISSFDNQFVPLSEQLSLRLGFPVVNDPPRFMEEGDFALFYDERGLNIQETGKKVAGPVRVDFVAGASNHRRLYGGGKSQSIAKAVGVSSKIKPLVWDMTAGLGGDSFVLASLGCQVQMFERNPVVAELLHDGLMRLKSEQSLPAELEDIASRLRMSAEDSRDTFKELLNGNSDRFELLGQLPDVIYLDPMFPHTDSTAKVKKEMSLFRVLVGGDGDADELLDPALHIAQHRVVVKRPRKAPYLNEKEPTYQLEGKANRFDIYALKAFS